MSGRGWVGVDLDGTLAHYSGWVSAVHIGEPIPAMADRVRSWIASGLDVRIFNARVGPQGRADEDIETIRSCIQDWTELHFGIRLPVTNAKDFGMIELWDDRAVQVIPNTGMRADGTTP